ncbi:MAG: flagellar basal body P-ring protein FlgI [Planctomycetota bacterium]|nr:flagellar basal body P-ring protein FlgI [Planctomycetota bacterium]
MLLSLTLLLFQAPVVTPDTAAETTNILPVRGIEAPVQPTGKSTARVTVGPRTGEFNRGVPKSGIMVRVSDVMRPRGQESNTLIGIGLITGLNGTGDSGGYVKQAMSNLLLNMNIHVTDDQLQAKNMAVVTVTADLPPGVRTGTRIDAKVSCFGDASSLAGGSLEITELQGLDGQVYATVGGSLSASGNAFGADGASAVTNHPTVAMVTGGCKVEREVAVDLFSEHGYLYLETKFRKGGFDTSVRVADTINELYPGLAVPIDAGRVRVSKPVGLPEEQYVPFIASVLGRELEAESFARVVVNSRTGLVVIGEGVRIGSGAVTKGDLTVTIAESPEVSQPGPLSGGETVEVPRSTLDVQEENRGLSLVTGAATLNEVVEVLNVLGVTSRDMIQILEAMSQSGMLHAEIITL